MSGPELTPHVLLTLGVAVGALALFIWGRLRVDVVGLIVLAALTLLGLVDLEAATSGFSNEATLTVAAMLVLSAGLGATGAIEVLSRWVVRLGGGSPLRLLLAVLLLVIPASALINNTAAVVTLLPVVLGVARARGLSPSRLLMPLSFGSQLGGTLTLIGTSTNLLVAGLLVDLGQPQLRIFDITPPALVLMGLGTLYLLTLGRWLIPERRGAAEGLSGPELREYLGALEVEPGGPPRPHLSSLRLQERYGLEVVGLQRGWQWLQAHLDPALRPGDVLLVRGRSSDLKQVEEKAGLRLKRLLPNLEDTEGLPLKLAELLVPPRSHVVGRRLGTLDQRAWEGVVVLALQRHGERLQGPIEDVRLMPGDLLLVEGLESALHRLHQTGELALVGPVAVPARRTRKLALAVGIMAGVVLLAALGVLPILVSASLGVLAMFLTGCIQPQEAYEQVDWMVVVLLGAIIPLGIAMERTGAASFLASGLLALTRDWGPYGVLAAVYLLTSLLTELISNNAAVVVLTPIAIELSEALGLSPLPFAVAVMFAGSNSFMTPVGYQTNTFIYGPGGYRFGDFLRVGGPLNLLMVAAATWVIPWTFPFVPA